MAGINGAGKQTGSGGRRRSAAEKRRAEALISLSLIRGLRAKTLLGLLERLGDPGEVLSRLKRLNPPGGGEAMEGPGTEDVDKAIMLLGREKGDVICILDMAYPPNLGNIHVPPPILFLVGDPDCLQSISVAIVGTRRADGLWQEGLEVAGP